MIIGCLTGIKLKDINNEVILYFIFSIIELIGFWGLLIITLLIDPILNRDYIALKIVSPIVFIFIFIILCFYKGTLLGGIRIIKNRKRKNLNKNWVKIIPESKYIKKEWHIPKRFVEDRYYRYYYIYKYIDPNGRIHKYKSIYFNKNEVESLSTNYLQLFVDSNNYNTYYTSY